MTVSSTTDRATFAGNGSTTVFPLPFRFFANAEIHVWLIDDATGSLTPQTLGTHYTLVGAAEPEIDGNPESELTMLTAPASGFSLFVQRIIPITQPTDIVNQGQFFPEIHENVFDRLTMLIQQGMGQLARAIRVNDSDPEPNTLPPAVQRAMKLLSFDALGNPIAVAPVAGSATDLELRLADNTDPANGAALVGLSPGKQVSDITSGADDEGSALIGYKTRTQYSRNQDRLHIFDWIPAVEHAAILAGTSTYDATADLQDALDEIAHGSTLWFPHRGQINITAVTVDKFNITLAGENSGPGFYASSIKGTLDGVYVITITQPQFTMRGLSLVGLSDVVEKGEDITQHGVLLTAPTQSNNLDAVFDNCSFLYFRDCVDMRGRNVKFLNPLFSNGRRGVAIDNYSLADVRGLEIYNPRFHSMGKLGSATSACVSIAAAANFAEVVCLGGDADDCLTLYKGFSSNTNITTPMYKARGQGIDIDATAATSSLVRRTFKIDYHYQGEGAIASASGALSAVGSFQLEANVVVMGCTGTAVSVSTNFAKISGMIDSAGQFANNTYDAVQIGTGAVQVFLDGLRVSQDQFGAKANKARYGVNDQGTDTTFGVVETVGTFGTAQFNKLSTTHFKGKTPDSPIRVAESYGTAAPVAGTWGRGSIVWHTAPTAAGFVGFVCIATGTPGTWKTFGAISA